MPSKTAFTTINPQLTLATLQIIYNYSLISWHCFITIYDLVTKYMYMHDAMKHLPLSISHFFLWSIVKEHFYDTSDIYTSVLVGWFIWIFFTKKLPYVMSVFRNKLLKIEFVHPFQCLITVVLNLNLFINSTIITVSWSEEDVWSSCS